MHVLAIVAAQEPVEPVGGLFDINVGLSFWTLIIFGVLLVVLYKFAYPYILGAVEERERRIQEILDAAARDREQAEQLLDEQRQLLAEARQHAQELVNEGKQAAERLRQEAVERGRTEQEAMLARAKQEIDRERELAVVRLRKEAVELSLAAAAKLVRHRLDSEEDHRFVRQYLADVQLTGDGAGAGA